MPESTRCAGGHSAGECPWCDQAAFDAHVRAAARPRGFLRRWWRRRWCMHYFEDAGYVSPIEREWACVRGCGKRVVLNASRIPFSYIHPWETVVGDSLVRRRV